jgi:hypothetical protein
MNPEKPQVEHRTNTDPKRKDSQGLDVWADSLLRSGLITEAERDEFIAKNNSKEEQLEKYHLPQLRHYGYYTSVEQIRERIHPGPDDRFIIRCKSRTNGEIKRLLDASLDEACAFGEELPGGFDAWIVEMKEYVETIAAGTIIVSPTGSTSIEMWKGGHYLNVTNCPKYHGSYNPDIFDQHYHWDAPEGGSDLAELQGYAIEALRYFFPNLKPHEHEQIYVEYGVRKDGSLYFMEANDAILLTGRDVGPVPDSE